MPEPTAAEPTRVVLIHPGDVLVISGVDLGEVDYDALTAAVSDFKRAANIPYVLFAQDPVEIGKLTVDQLRDALAALEAQ